MLLLGLLILACTAAFTGLVLSDNLPGGPDYNVTVLGNDIATMNTLAIFCAGLALALLFAVGVALMTGGLTHGRRTSRKLAAARREAVETARQRDDLAARLENTTPTARPQSAATSPPPGALPPRAGGPGSGTAGTYGATRVGSRRRTVRHLFGH